MIDLPRFFLPPPQILDEAVEFLEGDASHLQRVLRLTTGDRVYVLDGLGALYLVQLTALEKRAAQGRILSRMDAGGELPVPVTLIQGLPKGEKFDWILQKATELGVSRIQPVSTQRCVVKIAADKSADKLRRWDAIVREAAEQCERAKIPEVAPPCSLADWLGRPQDSSALILACLERADAPSLLQVLRETPRPSAFEVIIGPEGGFTPEESNALENAGAKPVNLGRRILRTETASLAALALISSLLES